MSAPRSWRAGDDVRILGLSSVIVNIDNRYIRSGESSHPYLMEHLEKLDEAVSIVSRTLKRRYAAEDRLEEDLGVLASLLTLHTPVTTLVSLCGEYGYGKTTVLINYIARKSFELIYYLKEKSEERKPSVIPVGVIYPHYMPPGDHPLAWLIYMLSNFIDGITELARKGTFRLGPERLEMLEEAKNIIDNELSEVAAIVMADHRIVLSQVAASIEELLDDMTRLSYAGMRFHSMYRNVSRYIREGLGLRDVPLLIAFDDVDSEPSKIYETLLTVRLLSTDPNNVFIVAFRCNYVNMEEILALEMARALAGPSVLGERAVNATRHAARTLLLKTLLSSVRVELRGLNVEERLSFRPLPFRSGGRRFISESLGGLLKKKGIYGLFGCKVKSSAKEEEGELIETPYAILLPPAPRSLSMLYFILASQPHSRIEAAKAIVGFIKERPTLLESVSSNIVELIKDVSTTYVWNIYGSSHKKATRSRRVEIRIQPFAISSPKNEFSDIDTVLQKMLGITDFLESELADINNKLIVARILERLMIEATSMMSGALAKSLYETTIMEINTYASKDDETAAVLSIGLRVPTLSLLHEWLTVLLANRMLDMLSMMLNIRPIMQISVSNIETITGQLAGIIGTLYLAYLDSLKPITDLVRQPSDGGCVLERRLTEKRYYVPLSSMLSNLARLGQSAKIEPALARNLASELQKTMIDSWDAILAIAGAERGAKMGARDRWYGLADFAGHMLSELGRHPDEIIREIAVKVEEVLKTADDELLKALSGGSK